MAQATIVEILVIVFSHRKHSFISLVVSNFDFTMFSNIGAVGAANNYAGDGGGSASANPYGPAGNNPMPSHFRRHGNAERFGGSMGITPPGTPPRSRQNLFRSESCRRRIDDDELPACREQPRRESSRDREEASDNAASTGMPTEWGACTMRAESRSKITHVNLPRCKY